MLAAHVVEYCILYTIRSSVDFFIFAEDNNISLVHIDFHAQFFQLFSMPFWGLINPSFCIFKVWVSDNNVTIIGVTHKMIYI